MLGVKLKNYYCIKLKYLPKYDSIFETKILDQDFIKKNKN